MTPGKEATRLFRENRFDVLRLAAAWLVLLNHCYPLSGSGGVDVVTRLLRLDTSGGLGVGIFFAISGYLVTISAERSASTWDFARRRMLRIYPALATVCVLSVLVLGPLATKLPVRDYFASAATWAYLKSAGGFGVAYHLPGVFEGNPSPAVNGSLWSLPYELRCYVALALVAALPVSLRVKTLAAVAFLAFALATRPLVPPASPGEKFLGLDYYATKLGLVFAVGASLAAWRQSITATAWHALGSVALLLLAVAWTLPFGAWPLVLYALCLPVATLWVAQRALWLPRIPERMGDLSYGVYLYAFPVQQLLAQHRVPELGMGAYLAASTAITVALAAFSWHVVEKRALRFKYAAPPPAGPNPS